jgi:hypothetical protein
MTSFFRIVDKRAIYRWYNLIRTCVGKYDWLFHWQHKLSATLSANVNLNYHVPIKIYYRICTFRHIRIEPPLTSNNWTQKKTTTYGVGSNLDPSLGKAPKCVEVNPVNCPNVDMLFRLDTSGHQAKQPFLSLILKYYFFVPHYSDSEPTIRLQEKCFHFIL